MVCRTVHATSVMTPWVGLCAVRGLVSRLTQGPQKSKGEARIVVGEGVIARCLVERNGQGDFSDYEEKDSK
jgi:hypothetical protein